MYSYIFLGIFKVTEHREKLKKWPLKAFFRSLISIFLPQKSIRLLIINTLI